MIDNWLHNYKNKEKVIHFTTRGSLYIGSSKFIGSKTWHGIVTTLSLRAQLITSTPGSHNVKSLFFFPRSGFFGDFSDSFLARWTLLWVVLSQNYNINKALVLIWKSYILTLVVLFFLRPIFELVTTLDLLLYQKWKFRCREHHNFLSVVFL